jgi:hypothetical protein
MANIVSNAFSLNFQADGTSTVITWNLRTDPILVGGTWANDFSLSKNLPTGFVFIDPTSGVSGALSHGNFTVTFDTPPPAGNVSVSVYFLFED